jgi:hypothetical protein
MRYDLNNPAEYDDAIKFIQASFAREKTVDIKVVRPQRSLKANGYYHLLLQICASEWGYSLAEMKIIHKRDISPSVFVYYKNDMPFTKSSSELNSKELSDAIEQLKKYSAEHDLVLPEPTDEEKMRYYEKQIQNSSQYL